MELERFKVIIRETYEKTVFIEAEDADKACEVAKDGYDNGEERYQPEWQKTEVFEDRR